MLPPVILVYPAFGGSRKILIVFCVITHIRDAFGEFEFTFGQGTHACDHLKNGSGRAACMDTVIQKEIAGISQDCHGIFAAGNKCVQIVSRIIGKSQYTALHIKNDQASVFSQLKRVFYPVTVMDIVLIGFKPGFGCELFFLVVTDGNYIVADASFSFLLVRGIQRQLDIIAVLRINMVFRKFPDNP